ncbi:helix-turn-helix domain-containing protein [Epilithonimonas hominis]|uniref:DNA binding domain-containing protein, excisionase family n=1 Tax=Epilithonimonas hominis TaxID=420404 RepID=A0A1H6HVN4_9FLAO|nr:helix-turn-helix domain-containing protein [Epilithonimonas hominis]SEH39999.1 DNA binding domain-containing protein, excisionase family [Epilithonimonas hominis]
MSSNISIQKVCEYCGKDFTAKTTVTRCCSDDCAKKAYKARKRAEKINNAIEVVEVKKQKKVKPIEDLREREFLTAKEVCILLNCSVRSVYYYISNGIIEATNLGNRLTRIKRSNIDKLFNDNLRRQPKEKQYNVSECFSISEAQKKYNISESALQKIIQREEIPKIKQGKFVYIPKVLIDEVFNTEKKDVF